jgi:hypothetical protein
VLFTNKLSITNSNSVIAIHNTHVQFAIKLRNIRQMAPLSESKLFHESNTGLRPCWCYSPTSTQLQIQIRQLPAIIHMSNSLAIKLRYIRQMAPLSESKLSHVRNTSLRPCWCYSPTSNQLQIQIRQLPSIIHMSDSLAVKLRNIRQMAPLGESKFFHQSNTSQIIF